MQPGSSGTPQFRHSVPSYAAPDRDAWIARHGADYAPRELIDVPPKFLSRARAACGRDYGTIDFVPAVNAHADLDLINQDLQAEFSDAANILVFFDPSTDSFWAYPQSPGE